MGFKLLEHSLSMIFSNLSRTLKITGILYLFTVAAAGLAAAVSPRSAVQTAQFSFPVALAALVSAFAFIWAAVGWHRYVLLDEVPDSWLPKFHGNRMLAYLGYSLVLFLVVAALSLAWFLVMYLVMGAAGGHPFVGMVLLIAFLFLGLLIAYRCAPMLPAAAIGKSISLGSAWRSTRSASGAIVGLTIVSVLLAVVIDLPMMFLRGLPIGVPLVIAWSFATGWLKFVVGISVLTTIYGHYVEGRSLA